MELEKEKIKGLRSKRKELTSKNKNGGILLRHNCDM